MGATCLAPRPDTDLAPLAEQDPDALYQPSPCFGRTTELRTLGQLLAPGRTADSGLVLVGEAGTGKSHLLATAATKAGQRTVLRCTGSESESTMPYAGLHQLIRPLLPAIDRLPVPQADALRAVFGLTRAATGRERFLAAVGTLTLFTEVATRRPLAILVDDADRLDVPSREILLFALRRLQGNSVVVIATARPGGGSGLDDGDLPALRIGPLSEEASKALLHAVARRISPSVAHTLVVETQGNPLALVEVATTLPAKVLAGTAALPDWLPSTERLRRAFGTNKFDLPEQTRTLLLLAAAYDGTELRPVLAAGRLLGVNGAALAPAERAGLLTVSEGEVRFRHPVTRPVVYHEAGYDDQRKAHQALAEVCHAPHRRAWHRACASDQSEDRITAELADAASAGDPRAARRLWRAVEGGAGSSLHYLYRVRAAEGSAQAGNTEQALALLAFDRGSDDPALRARIALVRAQLATTRGAPASGHLLVDAAFPLAHSDPNLAASLLAAAARTAVATGDGHLLAKVTEHVRRLQLDVGHWAYPLGMAASRLTKGDLRASNDLLTYQAVLPLVCSPPHGEPLAWAPMLLPLLIGFGDHARDHLSTAIDKLRAQNKIGVEPTATIPLVAMDYVAGRWCEGVTVGERATELADHTRQHAVSAHLRTLLALIAAARGERDKCNSLVRQAWRTSIPAGLTATTGLGAWALGLAELAAGDLERAVQHLREVVTPGRQGHNFLLAPIVVPDLVEAHVRRGDIASARQALGEAGEWTAGQVSTPASRALLRAHALLAEDDDRDTRFEAALGAANGFPFDLARAELAHGEWLRRERRIQPARSRLTAAVSGFAALGARPWAEQARAELRASGGSADGSPRPRTELLSPQEERIARLAAGGMTNPEIGARLFLSPGTVRYHLSKVFPKLNITSRHQLRDLGFAAARD